MQGRPRLTDMEVAEIRRRRPGVRASLACEDMHLTPEEEALFVQMDAERLTPDEAAQRIIEFRAVSGNSGSGGIPKGRSDSYLMR